MRSDQLDLIKKMQVAAKMAIDTKIKSQKMLEEIKSICKQNGLSVNEETGEIYIKYNL